MIKSPGIKPNTKFLIDVKNKGIPVIGDLELFYRLFKSNNIIAITGSNGKTTTTILLGKLLKNEDYLMGGNIGIPLFTYTNVENDKMIIETSSYMLDSTFTFKPHIYVLLNIESHHLDYHESFYNYLDAKMKVIKNLTENDYLIYNLDDDNINKYLPLYLINKTNIFTFSLYNNQANLYFDNDNLLFNKETLYKKKMFSNIKNKIFYDYLAVILVGIILKIDRDEIKNCLLEFKGILHRQEIIYQTDELIVINDSKATNPYATLCAFEWINMHYPDFQTLWLGGGKKINEKMNLLTPYIHQCIRLYLTGENKYELIKELDLTDFPYQLFPNYNEAIKALINDINTIYSDKKIIILFSPAAPSLDMFSSFEKRGDYFKKTFLSLFNKKNRNLND